MTEIPWEHYRSLHRRHLRRRGSIRRNLGLAPNTIAAYGRALNDYLTFCHCHQILAEPADQGTSLPVCA